MAIDISDVTAGRHTARGTGTTGLAAARPDSQAAVAGASATAAGPTVAGPIGATARRMAAPGRAPSFESALARAGWQPALESAETRRTVYDSVGTTPEEREASLRWAANQLESFLVNELFKAMRATVKDGGLIQKSRAEKMYQQMLDEEMSKVISESSPLGIADVIVQQLEDRI